MSEILYLDMTDMLALHTRQVERFGGADGIRDAGLLDAAINRPQSGYYAYIFEQAAALWESLTMHHCFIDGNKRVGFASVYVSSVSTECALLRRKPILSASFCKVSNPEPLPRATSMLGCGPIRRLYNTV